MGYLSRLSTIQCLTDFKKRGNGGTVGTTNVSGGLSGGTCTPVFLGGTETARSTPPLELTNRVNQLTNFGGVPLTNLRESSHPFTVKIARVPDVDLGGADLGLGWLCVIAAHIYRPSKHVAADDRLHPI